MGRDFSPKSATLLPCKTIKICHPPLQLIQWREVRRFALLFHFYEVNLSSPTSFLIFIKVKGRVTWKAEATLRGR